MFQFFRLFPIPMFLFLTAAVYGGDVQVPWVSIDLPVDREPSAVRLLESKEILTLSWSNAEVEVSAFEGLESLPLAQLDQRLTPQDPRWDPWLSGLKAFFRPLDSVSRIWVEFPQNDKARRLLGHDVLGTSAPPPSEPRRISGWILAVFSLLYFVFRSWADGKARRSRVRRNLSGRLWLPLTLLLAGGGLFLGAGGGPPRHEPSVSLGASWLQHLWFQESWPYGATWKDWIPGKAWSYRSYERKDGRLFEVMTSLPTPDRAWILAAESGWDPHQAARIFGPENP